MLGLASFLIFYWVIKVLNPRNPVFFLSLWFILSFNSIIASRAILFYLTFYLGLSYYGKRTYIQGLIIIIISLFFHKTGYIAFLIFLISLIPIRRKALITILSITIITSLVIRGTIMNNLNILYDFFANAGIPGSVYLTYEENRNATGSIIWSILPLILYLIDVIFISFTLYKCSFHINIMSSLNKLFYYFSYWGLIISVGLRLINLPDPTISGRTLFLIILPTLYLFTSLKQFDSSFKYNTLLLINLSMIVLLCTDVSILRVGLINKIF